MTITKLILINLVIFLLSILLYGRCSIQMKKQKIQIKHVLSITLLILFICVIAFVDLQRDQKTIDSPRPIQGYLDLSDWSFDTHGTVRLEGEWAFYFDAFLTPKGADATYSDAPTYIDVPSTTKKMNTVKPFESNMFHGTLRLVVKLPDDGSVYGLKTDIVLSAYELYIDGKPVGTVGNVGTQKSTSAPYYKVLRNYFTPESNLLEIIIHTSDYHFGDCAISTPIIGLADQIVNESRMGLGRDLFLFGMLMIMGIYHLGLFLMRTKDRTPLYFGLCCLSFALRMLIVGERFLPTNFEMDFMIYARTSYLTVYFGTATLSGFLYFSFRELFARWFLIASILIGVISSVLAVVLPMYLVDLWIYLYMIACVILLGYALIKLAIGVIRGVPFTSGVLIGFFYLLLTFFNDYLYEITLANKGSMIPFGIFVFVLIQAYTLSAKFSSAFSSVEKLSKENASMLQEVKDINTNLEVIVEARTADLMKTLDEMDLMSKTDFLTKLPNRRSMLQRIDRIIKSKQPFYMAVADIDNFKIINDTFGHDCGDTILIELSEQLTHIIGDDGFVGRWGGEEFLIIIYAQNDQQAFDQSEKIRRHIESYVIHAIDSVITFTIGLCKYDKGKSVENCIALADKALYEGKDRGRNQSRIWNP